MHKYHIKILFLLNSIFFFHESNAQIFERLYQPSRFIASYLTDSTQFSFSQFFSFNHTSLTDGLLTETAFRYKPWVRKTNQLYNTEIGLSLFGNFNKKMEVHPQYWNDTIGEFVTDQNSIYDIAQDGYAINFFANQGIQINNIKIEIGFGPYLSILNQEIYKDEKHAMGFKSLIGMKHKYFEFFFTYNRKNYFRNLYSENVNNYLGAILVSHDKDYFFNTTPYWDETKFYISGFTVKNDKFSNSIYIDIATLTSLYSKELSDKFQFKINPNFYTFGTIFEFKKTKINPELLVKKVNEQEKFKIEFGAAIAYELKQSWVITTSVFRKHYYWVDEAKAEVSLGVTYKLY